jgi:hypothetical protein
MYEGTRHFYQELNYMTDTTKAPIILDLDKTTVVEPKGAIEDAITRRMTEPREAENWKYLAPGSSMIAPAGSAYYIKTKDEWFLSQFFDKGRLVGPIVFSETSIETPVEALRREKMSSGEFESRIMASGVFATLIPLFYFIFIHTPAIPQSTDNLTFAYSVLAILSLSLFASVRPIASILLNQNNKVREIIKDKFSYSRQEFTAPSKPLPVDVIED